MNTARTDRRGQAARLPGLDVFRGLIMALMALDHASYFVAGVHPAELWSRPLPRYEAVLPFATRLVSHLCAPGFFLLMGTGLALFAASRERAGWTPARIGRHLALRGAVLVVLQFLVENPAWSLGDSGVLRVTAYCGVLYGLGAALCLWAALWRLPTALVAALSLAALAAAWVLPPVLGQGGDVPPWLGLLLVPGRAGPAYVLYPAVPWWGVAGFGLCLGRLLGPGTGQARRFLALAGAACLAGFAAIRLAGWGDFHPPAGPGWMAFLNVTKYPPSLDFLLMTLGVDALILSVLLAQRREAGRWEEGLAVFGRAPLFFYLVHLYAYALIGRALPRTTTLAGMYPVWLLGLAGLWPLCRAYGRFKAGRPAASLWRLL